VGFEGISAVLNVQRDVDIECIKYPDSSYTRNADTAFGKFAPILPHEP
jgi:hypothetical protein